MTGFGARMRATIRIARRDALRARGRTLLVLLLIGLPVMAVSAMSIVDASAEPLPATIADRALGTDGQARITWMGLTDLLQDPQEKAWEGQDAQTEQTLGEIEQKLTQVLATGAILERKFPDSLDAETVPETYGVDSDDPWQWIVKNADVTWDDVVAVNDLGALALSRAVIISPPADDAVPYYTSQPMNSEDSGASSGTVLIVGLTVFVTFEVVLLIGPAFAIGTRRTERQLALIAASGGDQRTLRQIVLLGGFVVGLSAAVTGVAAGIGVVAGVRWVLRMKNQAIMPDLQIPVLTLFVILAIGTVLAVVAAWLPARSAAQIDVVAALAGRPTRALQSRRTPMLAIVLIIVGLAAATLGAIKGITFAMGGVALVLTGLVLAGGAVLTVLVRAAPRLGLATRYAVRDASRQRSRTTPAIAATMAGIAAVVAAGIYIESDTAQKTASHLPLGSIGSAMVRFENGSTAPTDPELQRDIEGVLTENFPVTGMVPIQVAALDPTKVSPEIYSEVISAEGGGNAWAQAVFDPDQQCPAYLPDAPEGEFSQEQFDTDPRCQPSGAEVRYSWGGAPGQSSMVVDDGTLVTELGLPASAEAARVLQEGKVIVTDPRDLWPDGQVHLEFEVVTPTEPEALVQEVIAPGVLVDLDWHYNGVIIPPKLLDSTSFTPEVSAVFGAATGEPSEAAEATTTGALQALDSELTLQVERGYQDSDSYTFLILAGLAAAVGLGATGISVALTAAESRTDLATLGAIGASPRTRRRIAGAQALVIAGTGAVLGTTGGIAFAWILVLFERHREVQVNLHWALHVPIPTVVAILIGIPILAALGSYLLTRSRLPMTRRVEL